MSSLHRPHCRLLTRRQVVKALLSTNNYDAKRAQLTELLRTISITDERVLNSIRSVPRHEFVPKPITHLAYDNISLSAKDNGHTIPQPQIVAEMIQAAEIKLNNIVLQIGTGSGYSAAVMSNLAGLVWTLEINAKTHEAAKETLKTLGYRNVIALQGDGRDGYPQSAPYDAILVTVSTTDIPDKLLTQLAVGGRMIIPVYDPSIGHDRLIKVLRTDLPGEKEYTQKNIGFVRFLPMLSDSDTFHKGAR